MSLSDAKGVPSRTFRHFVKHRGEKEGKFSEWCSKALGKLVRGLAWGTDLGRPWVVCMCRGLVLKGDTVVGSSQVTESESLCGANRVWGGWRVQG